MMKKWRLISRIKNMDTKKPGLVKDVFDSLKKILIVIIVGIIIIRAISLSQRGVEDKKLTNGTFMIKPSSIFQTEELKRLEPHLNMKSGAVEMRYKGNQQYMQIKYEFWEKDKLKASKDILGVDISKKDRFKGEYNEIISLSLKNETSLNNMSGGTSTILTAVIGEASSSTIIEDYPIGLGYNFTENNSIEPIVIDENEESVIWELTSNHDDLLSSEFLSEETIEEDIKFPNWRLVLKVYFK